MPSRGLAAWQAVTSTIVSPERTMTEPSACFASLPVSMESERDPTRISRLCRFTLCIALVEPLLADAQTTDQLRIAFRVLALEIVEQPSALADEFEKPPARVMVLRVGLEMLGEVIDALTEERDLNFGGSGIAVVCLVRSDKVGLAVL